MQIRQPSRSALRWIAAAAIALAAAGTPAAVLAGADQIVIEIVDEVIPTEFVDECTGVLVHGDAVENGVLRITDLGDQGLHVRLDVRGVVDLYDEDGTYVGTWTYRLAVRDQIPPDRQGSFTNWAVGPIVYADGNTAIQHGVIHRVFEKGDVVKSEFFTAGCAGY